MWGWILSAACGRTPEALPADEGVPPEVAPEPPAPPLDAVEPLPASGPFSRELAPGLWLSGHLPPAIPDAGYARVPQSEVQGTDPRLYVVTIDPARYEIVYRSALEGSGAPETAAAWAERDGLQVVWNPGMFEPDGRATGYTRSGRFVSQPEVRRNGLYRAWFVSDPGSAAVLDRIPPKGAGPYAAFAELPADLRAGLDGHALVVQSLAVLRGGQPAYPPRKNQWSELCYGTDRQGRVIVVFSRFPYEMRELGARIEALGLGIEGLLHGEGGPEASLVIRAGGVSFVGVGSYETGFSGDDNHVLWTLPAVMGARPR